MRTKKRKVEVPRPSQAPYYGERRDVLRSAYRYHMVMFGPRYFDYNVCFGWAEMADLFTHN